MKRPALWLVILALLATVVFSLLGLHGSWEPPYLNLVLHLTLVTLTALLVAALAWRSFRQTGSWPVLWLGAGSLTFGLVNALSNSFLQLATVNAAVTTNNLGVLLAATLYFLGAFFAYNDVVPRQSTAGRLSSLLQVYLGSAAIVAVIAVAALQGLIAPFFIQGQGGTPWRQLVVTAAGLLFLFAGLTFLDRYRHSKADFLYWYGLGLLLISLVMAGTLLTTATGTSLSWLVRMAQLLSALYLLAAVLVTLGHARASNLPPEAVLASFFWRDEANLRQLFESIEDAIIVTDRRLVITDWNQAAEHVYGWQAGEVVGKPVGDVLHTTYLSPGEGEQALVALQEAGTWRGEVLQRQRSGQPIPVLATVSNLRDAAGQVVGTVAVNRDITERKRIEDHLRQSEEQSRDLIRYAPSGIFEVDFRTGRFRSVNDAMCAVLGYSRAALLQTTAFDLLDDAGKALFADRIRRTLAGEQTHPLVEYRVLRKDGSAIYAVLNVRITYTGGQPDGAFVIAHDVTERRRAAEELRLAAEMLERRVQERTAELERANAALRYQADLLENVNDAIMAYDADLRITSWNRCAEEQYGWTAAEVMGTYAPDAVGSQLPAEQRTAILRAMAETGRWQGEVRHTRRDGTPIIVDATSMLLRDEAGRVAAYVTVNRDVTERKRMEQELLASREQLQNLAHRLVQLQEDERRAVAYQLHDDVGQVLTSLSIGLRILQMRYKTSPEAQAHIEQLRQQADQIHASLHDLGANLRPVTLDKLGLLSALHLYVDQFEQRYDLAATLSVVGVTRVALPTAAQTALYRIVQEALINAARYAQARNVEVLVQRRDRHLVIIIEDDGQGFDVAEAERSGHLGILGMRERAEMLGGHFAVESVAGRGTTVCVEVPLAGAETPVA